jgi:hypothetical protein
MFILLLSKPRQLFERRLISLNSTKETAFDYGVANNDQMIIHWRWLSLRVCIILILLLTALLLLFEITATELIIATFSIGVSSLSHLMRLSSVSHPIYSAFHPLENEVLNTLDAIGMAGVGTIVVLYLLT